MQGTHHSDKKVCGMCPGLQLSRILEFEIRNNYFLFRIRIKLWVKKLLNFCLFLSPSTYVCLFLFATLSVSLSLFLFLSLSLFPCVSLYFTLLSLSLSLPPPLYLNVLLYVPFSASLFLSLPPLALSLSLSFLSFFPSFSLPSSLR